MYSRSRLVEGFREFAIDASCQPFSRIAALGIPHRQKLLAMPQCAMAHLGSCWATCLKVASAVSNANECSSATPRSNSFCTAGAQEVGKYTEPRTRQVRTSSGPGSAYNIAE